jgi:cytoskeletal protein CcmA (bactofilin family)
MPQVPERIVRCYHCRAEVRLPAAARSASCPLCFKGLILDDLTVKESGYSTKLLTCGKVTVERKARAVTRSVEACAGVEILGSLEAKVLSHGPVYIGPGARMKGDCEARSLLVAPGAVIEGGFFRIGAEA